MPYHMGIIYAEGFHETAKHSGKPGRRNGKIRKLLDDYGVIELSGPTYYPQYNGKQERSMRDIKCYERAMRRHGIRGSLEDRIREAIHDLNEQRPRPVLAGRTAREAMEHDQICLPDRREFRKEVDKTEKKLLEDATSRKERENARRHAVEQVLLRYRLMIIWGDVSTNFRTQTGTN